MKKLLILAAALVAGVAANAASFKWTGGNIYTSNGTDKLTGTVTIMAYTTDVASAVKVADAFVVGGTLKSDAAGSANGFTYNWTDAVGGTAYNFYMIIEDAGKTIDTSMTDPTKIIAATAQATSTPTVAFSSMATITQNAANWQSVPEPTSGLLMLLGMAGLALRRRHA